MKKRGYRIFAAGAVLVMMASTSMAEVIRYRLSGDWFSISDGTTPGWWKGVAPRAADDARMNWGNNTVTLSNGVAEVGALQTGWDEPGNLLIADGGDLSTTLSAITNNSVIGFNNVGTLTVQTGGTALFRHNFLVGQQASGIGTVNIDGGTVTVEGEFRLGDAGTGAVFVNQGGILNLSGLATNGVGSIRPGSKLDIGGTGKVIISGDAEDAVALYVASGTLLGNGVVSNVNVQVTMGGGETNTTITALLVVPNLIGNDLTAASNSLVNLGYVLGTVGTNYVVGAISESILSQDPVGGSSAPVGSTIDVVIQEAYLPQPRELNVFLSTAPDGDWMTATNWSKGVAPVRETQNYNTQLRHGVPVILTNDIRVSSFIMGDGAVSTGISLTITGGGSMIAAKDSLGGTRAVGIGWSRPSVLTIETNSLFVAEQALLLAREGIPSESEIRVDGGTCIIKSFITCGSIIHGTTGKITVDNGGFFSAQRFYTDQFGSGNSTNGSVNILDGTFELSGNKTNFMAGAIASGFFVIGPDSLYTVDYDVTTAGKTTLRVVRPGYSSWARGWGVDIGSETDDYDNDSTDNLLEYALNGDPTNALDTGVAPVLVNDGGGVKYIHLSRADAFNLVYTVQTRDDLTIGDWVDGGSTVIGTEITGGDYNVVTNLVTPVKDQSFLRLKVDNP